jgi:hypothetical protein
MAPLSPELLQAVARELSRLPLDVRDLESVAAPLAGQMEGLARLDELDLSAVEPATVLRPDPEGGR